LNINVIISYSSAVYVVIVIIIGNCATVNIVVGHSAALNIVICVNAIAVYRAGTDIVAVAGTVVCGINSAGAVTGAVSIYQCSRIVATLIDQCLSIGGSNGKNHTNTYYYFFEHGDYFLILTSSPLII